MTIASFPEMTNLLADDLAIQRSEYYVHTATDRHSLLWVLGWKCSKKSLDIVSRELYVKLRLHRELSSLRHHAQHQTITIAVRYF